MNHRRISLTLLLAVLLCGTSQATADENSVSANEQLKNDQQAVSGRYARFERLLSQMADMLGHEDPARAELLRRAVSQGREQGIAPELEAIANTLDKADYGAAREKQVAVTKSLQALLKLLQSEDRRSSVEKERERLKGVLKDVRNAIAAERAARAVAQNSEAPSNAAPEQQKALNRTDKILQQIHEHDQVDEGAETGNDSASEDGQPSEQAEASGSGGESQAPQQDGGDSDEADQKHGKQSEGDPSPNSEGEPSGKDRNSGQPSESASPQPGGSSQGSRPSPGQGGSKPSSGQSESEQTPGTEQLEDARRQMEQALEQLQQQERDKALEAQDQSIAELQKAAAQLEKTLQQLREEEKEMVLASLEARLQRLHAVQSQIHELTVDLAKTPRDEWLDNSVSQCRELAQQQTDLTQECSQTTGLLREDGTSVSILVAVEDIEVDMDTVAERLRQTKVAALTQSVQTDIIESLKQLIEATQREMEEMKSEERQQQQQQKSQQEKPPLVELMAEIRVLRSLQVRVNRRTRQIHELMLEGDAGDRGDLSEQLSRLAERQTRLRESALELGKRK